MVRYIDGGYCSYPTFEVIGKKYNYVISRCQRKELDQEFQVLEDIVKSMKLIE